MKKLVILLVIICLGVVMMGRLANAPVNRLERMPTRVITVGPGDTLWDIAKESGINSIDIRIIVSHIKTSNNCDTVLRLGERLEVPYQTSTLARADNESESESFK